eukprot:m.151750 g.151750  ORF g.151750 m.151750 type:complete len:387 (-) comp23361_c0_seq1:77-1237(-)
MVLCPIAGEAPASVAAPSFSPATAMVIDSPSPTPTVDTDDPGLCPTVDIDITGDVPLAVLERARTAVGPRIAVLQGHRNAMAAAETPSARRVAHHTLRQARDAAMSELQLARKAARRAATEAAARDPDLQVARVAIQLFRQQLGGLGGRGGAGRRPGRGACRGPAVTQADLDAATLEMRATAATIAAPHIETTRALRAAVHEAIGFEAQARMRPALLAARKGSLEQLMSARKDARAAMDAGSIPVDSGQAKIQLVIARLAIQLFRKSDPTAVLDDLPREARQLATATVNRAQATLKPLREIRNVAIGQPAKRLAQQALKAAREQAMARLQAARKAARAAVDAAATKEERRARLPALQQAKATIQLFRLSNQAHSKECGIAKNASRL